MQLSKAQVLQLTSISGGGLHGDYAHATLSQAFKQEAKDGIQLESQPSDSNGTDEDYINPYLTESERRDLSDSQSDKDSDSEQDEPLAKRRCA